MTKRAPMTFAAMTLALCLPMTAMARTGDPVLLAELDAPGGGTTCCGAAPPVSMTFCLVYGFQDFTASQAAPYVDADLILGCSELASDPPAYFDFDGTSGGDYTAFVAELTDGVDQNLTSCGLSIDASDKWTGPGSCGTGPESAALKHLKARAMLAGRRSVDFVRLVVHKAVVGSVDGTNSADWDVTWQFWQGAPLAGGGDQPTEIEDFLQYVNPLQKKTVLHAGETSFPLTIVYGPTIDPATFTATLNDAPLGGFTPVAGARETVSIPLATGTNVLRLAVSGTKASGGTATDRDTLRFVIP